MELAFNCRYLERIYAHTYHGCMDIQTKLGIDEQGGEGDLFKVSINNVSFYN